MSWRALEGCVQSSHFYFKRITVTPEWLMGWRGKERIKETNQEATAALQVRSVGQVAGGACGGGVKGMDWKAFGSGMGRLADRLEVRGQGGGGTKMTPRFLSFVATWMEMQVLR